MSEKNVRKHVFLSGRVQGVGFRAYTRRQAQQNDIKGWVKNLTDGRLEAVLAGEKDKVGLVLNKLEQGPALGRVENMEIRDEKYQNEFDRFSIRY